MKWYLAEIFMLDKFSIAVLLILSMVLSSCATHSRGNSLKNNSRVIQCSYDPQSKQPNPLGMRSFIKVIEKEGSTSFIYEQFPQLIVPSKPATISVTRTIIMHDTPITAARSRMRENLDYYHALVGSNDSIGFSTYDEAMKCRQQ